jgi:ADP-ribose pyrophosphatase
VRDPWSKLPPLPAIRLATVRDDSAGAKAVGGFLNLQRLTLVARYPDGTESAPFAYDVATRACLDAAVICAHFRRDGVRHVFLRSAVRPPCALRELSPPHDGLLWELPAGLIEIGEAPAACAARELEEELGVIARPEDLAELGPWTFPVPGMCGERQLFFHVEVDPDRRARPTEDGSALERHAAVCALPLAQALEECRRGAIRDGKTEVALRRLVELS